MLKDFITWLENDADMIKRETTFPASADVIRTGQQPQLGPDGGFNSNKQQEDHDKIMAIDGHIQRIREAIRDFQPHTKQGYEAKKLTDMFCNQWTEISSPVQPANGDEGLGSVMPQDIEYRKANQPLPEPGRSFNAPPPAF